MTINCIKIPWNCYKKTPNNNKTNCLNANFPHPATNPSLEKTLVQMKNLGAWRKSASDSCRSNQSLAGGEAKAETKCTLEISQHLFHPLFWLVFNGLWLESYISEFYLFLADFLCVTSFDQHCVLVFYFAKPQIIGHFYAISDFLPILYNTLIFCSSKNTYFIAVSKTNHESIITIQ